MKAKIIIKVILLGFVAVSMGWLIIHHGQAPTAGADPQVTPAGGASTSDLAAKSKNRDGAKKAVLPNRVIVYYFHTTNRCPTCHKIENYTQEAVESGFAKELRDGRVELQVLNIDEPANAHFIQDYQLHTKSVVVVDIKDGKQARWNNLTKVWELVGDQPAFVKYVQDEVNLYLQGK
jgi:hypothetical protein